jgi:hypothetical protein
LKPVLHRIAVTWVLLILAGAAAQALPPTLTPIDPGSFTQEAHPGESRAFSVTYTQSQGDPPKALDMVIETPGGQVTEHAAIPPGDPTQGIPVTWTYTPENSGTYRFHFEAVSATGESVRLPTTPADDYEFASVNPLVKIGIFVAGLAIAFLILPFVIYVAARSVNRRGDPAAAARIGLFIGVLASLGLYLYLFASDYGALGIVLACVAALGILILLFSRRRAV